MPPKSGFSPSTTQIIVAITALIGVLVVGWWQFGRKSSEAHLYAINVKDVSTMIDRACQSNCPCRKCYPSRMLLKSATTSATRANPATGCNNVTCPVAGEITIRQPQVCKTSIRGFESHPRLQL
jgi:hypothetical protein